ncbi:c-type cytochrome [Maritimibacter fusiformis]|uniref:Cytochrome c n=1 Tax=Maritimibacter fusiformis TaxID=2603819 RepID=A0A5D0RJ44_9RHOB|nr:cytochrome c [Maritimibacter fusiformis]TYB81463.1 cytochrome c [Maritimibacter fusiformis]
MSFSRSLVLGLSGAALVAGALFAASHAEKNPAVEARKSLMQLMAFNLAPIGAMAKDEMPYDAETASTAAGNLLTLSRVSVGPMFPEGSDSFSRDDTRALPEIWDDMAGFSAHLSDLTAAAEAMVTAAGTDLDALKQAMQPLGGACGGCHKDFRQPE